MSETLDRPKTDVVVIEKLNALEVFAPGGVDGVIERLTREVRSIPIDISTASGREHCASIAYKVARSKTALDKMGKDLTEDWRKRTGLVNADRRTIVERLDALRDEVRAPLDAYEAREKARIAAHEEALAGIAEHPEFGHTESAADLAARLVHLRNPPARDWQEFDLRAAAAYAAEIERTERLHAAAVKREAEAAELERLRAEEAERQRVAAADAQRQREAELARKAADAARVEAEQAAAREAQRVAREAEEARLAAERAHRAREEALAAEARRVEEERIAAELRAAQERQEAAEREAAADRRARAAEEATRAAQARHEAEQRQAAEDALAARREAVLAEQRRVAEEKAAEAQAAAARAASKARRAKVNNRAREALVVAVPGLTEEMATAAVVAIARGEVPGMSVAY